MFSTQATDGAIRNTGKLRVFLSLIVGVAVVLALSGCAKTKLFTWHQVVTLVVDTPNGEKRGRLTQEMRATYFIRPPLGSSTQVNFQTEGGPFILDMGDGNVLFGVLNTAQLAERIYQDLLPRWDAYHAFTSDVLPAPREMDFTDPKTKNRMYFFRFRDLSDPDSVELVDVTDLAASFGSGYALRSAVLRIEGVETPLNPDRIHDILPWIATHEDGLTPLVGGRSFEQLWPFEVVAGVKK